MRHLMRHTPFLSALLVLFGLSVAPAHASIGQEEASEAGEQVDPDGALQAQLGAQLKSAVAGRADSTKVKVNKPKAPPKDWQERVDRAMGKVNSAIASVFFYDVGGSTLGISVDATSALDDPTTLNTAVESLIGNAASMNYGLDRATITLEIPTHTATGEQRVAKLTASKTGIPFTVLWLVLGAIYFTFRMGMVQLRLLGHAIQVTRGRFDSHDNDDHGEVSHFQALTAALSATVGLGNIAGVAIAISIGGPGATLWMIIAGFLGMASKFTECSLGQMYRQQRPDGSVMGGAMYYLSNGLKEMGLGGLGRMLAVLFAILCVGGSLAGGNSFQVNQSLQAIQETVPFFKEQSWVYGLIMTLVVGFVILGGLKRIAQTAEKIVPTMCGVYVLAAMFVILSNASEVPAAFNTIISGAMSPEAGFGGLVGVLVQGFKRAAFSNEAGVGSAAIAHSAAKTEYPVREGIVALLEPLIDTIIVCTMTALVIVITGAYKGEVNGEPTVFAPYLENANGAGLTSLAFKQSIEWFPYVLSVAVVLFAFSTMISWSYYGERCWVWLFGDATSIIYKIIFLVFAFLGSVITAIQVLEFGDLMILGMALPNVLGVVLLSGKVRGALNDYMGKLRSGEIKPVD